MHKTHAYTHMDTHHTCACTRGCSHSYMCVPTGLYLRRVGRSREETEPLMTRFTHWCTTLLYTHVPRNTGICTWLIPGSACDTPTHCNPSTQTYPRNVCTHVHGHTQVHVHTCTLTAFHMCAHMYMAHTRIHVHPQTRTPLRACTPAHKCTP